jgi:hypothetical protein
VDDEWVIQTCTEDLRYYFSGSSDPEPDPRRATKFPRETAQRMEAAINASLLGSGTSGRTRAVPLKLAIDEYSRDGLSRAVWQAQTRR